jgi:PhnB protein
MPRGQKVHSRAANMFRGERWSMLEDPTSKVWQIATHVEEVSPEEMRRRMANLSRPG